MTNDRLERARERAKSGDLMAAVLLLVEELAGPEAPEELELPAEPTELPPVE